MTARHLVRIVLALCAIHGPAAALPAQGRGMGGAGGRSDVHDRRTNAVRPESSLTMPAEMVRAVAVLVTGLPRSFQVVAVPVPEALPGDGAISYEVLPSGGATILGSQSGRIPPGRSR